jgi:hypothetical protein
MPDKREWSLLTKSEMEAYLEESQRLVDLGAAHNIGLFPAALAGVALIREAVDKMGGDIEWWVRFLRSGAIDMFDRPVGAHVTKPPGGQQ